MIPIGQIPISEIFGPTIQCEGFSQGKKVVFVRLWGCNLDCVWCDTPYAINAKRCDPKVESTLRTHAYIMGEIKRLAPDIKSVVISGGEPMIYQSELLTLLNILKYEGYWVEIETNGTIDPKPRFLELIDQINCSPKTSNSGSFNTRKRREKPAIIRKYVACEKTNFKFVVCGPEDIPEINRFIKKYKIGKDRVRLMPQAQTREEYFKPNEKGISFDTTVQVLADRNDLLFTSRLQMYYYGNKRGH